MDQSSLRDEEFWCSRNRGMNPTARVAYALIRGCKAISDLHGNGFIHGDPHLDNIMRGEDENITIIDFAASTPIKDLRPPEVAASQADDLSELYRDLVLAQFHIGRIDESPPRKSIEQIDDFVSA
jgi:predicted unusual protein kinase regulating ubiquinone biosynthesis (AarF/ABC1/UbiB family)